MSTPLVVGQICHGSMGGSSRMACRLADALARRGHEVHLFSRVPVPWPVDAAIRRHVCAASVSDRDDPLSWTPADRADFTDMLASALAADSFDLLHYHYARPFAHIVGHLAPRPPVVGTLHGTDLTGCADAVALGRELAATDALTTVSEYMRRRCAVLPANPCVLPNFVEDAWPTHTAGAQPTLVHVSNFRAIKGIGLLARLYRGVYERTGARLVLVGDGPQLPVLRSLLEGTAVCFVGDTAHPEQYCRHASLLLSTSREESFGLALLEAMAVGLPVVATAVGGVPELVEDEVTGLLFDARDVAATVQRIVDLLGSGARLRALGAAGLERASALRESRVIGRYEQLYREVLGA